MERRTVLMKIKLAANCFLDQIDGDLLQLDPVAERHREGPLEIGLDPKCSS